MVGGNGVEIAWRVLDAQYWGVPQRRKRIFLVADFGGCCAGEILFKPESVRGDIETCRGEGEGIAGSIAVGIGVTGGVDMYNQSYLQEKAQTLRSESGGDSKPTVLVPAMGFKANSSIADNAPVLNECIPPLQVTSQMAVCFGADLSQKAEGIGFKEEVAACLAPGTHGGHGMHVISTDVCDMTHADEVMRLVPGGKTQTLNVRMGTGGNKVPVIHKHGYKVRRLTPTECERLQGLSDGYTTGGSDTVRYKAIGNGMAQPCPDYVMEGIAEVLKAMDETFRFVECGVTKWHS